MTKIGKGSSVPDNVIRFDDAKSASSSAREGANFGRMFKPGHNQGDAKTPDRKLEGASGGLVQNDDTPPTYDLTKTVTADQVLAHVARHAPEVAALMQKLLGNVPTGNEPSISVIAGSGGDAKVTAVGNNIFIPAQAYQALNDGGDSSAKVAGDIYKAFQDTALSFAKST